MSKPFLQYSLNTLGIKDTAKAAMELIEQRRKVVATINAHSTCVAQDDAAFSGALMNADMLLADGASVVLAGRALGIEVSERVSGYDFFNAVSELAQEKGGVSYFFLGSSQAVLDKMATRLQKDFPAIKIAGTLSPPFKPEFSDEDNAAMIKVVNAAKPDVLWVGMTAPKQEKWMEAHKGDLDVGFSAAIGAVFDFYAGTKSRAPAWMQAYGLEWLHRLLSEPKRVWRRYIINNPRFALIILKAWMNKR